MRYAQSTLASTEMIWYHCYCPIGVYLHSVDIAKADWQGTFPEISFLDLVSVKNLPHEIHISKF